MDGERDTEIPSVNCVRFLINISYLSTHYWWDQMPGPKHFYLTPNAEHSEATGILAIVPAIGTWLEYLLHKKTVPTFEWTISPENGEIVATLDGEGLVHKASMWYAYSCGTNPDGVQRRDFRVMSLDNPCSCGVLSDGYCLNLKSMWTEIPLQETRDASGVRTYRAHMDAPTDGRYVAYLIDIKYEKTELGSDLKHADVGGLPYDKPGQLDFTTEVSIWPNTFPYPDCNGESCQGVLL
jgi:hypothetical protein